MKFSIKDYFSQRNQTRKKLRIWSHLLKKPLMENFIFCAMIYLYIIQTERINNSVSTNEIMLNLCSSNIFWTW